LIRAPKLIPEDLSPGDQRSASADLGGIQFHLIESAQDPLFPRAFDKLTELFGPRNEMETLPVITHRLGWNTQSPQAGKPLFHYAMILALDPQDQIAAVRDYTAIVHAPPERAACTVHLSHLWVDPTRRRSGLAGWMRAFPVQTARTLLHRARHALHAPITLVGEMELPDQKDEARMVRLIAYEKAGYLKVDAKVMPYFQPDFRDPAEIDASGRHEFIPMTPILRRVGHEAEKSAPASELRAMIRDLYAMYSDTFRPADMDPLWKNWKAYPEGPVPIPLIPPTQV
jgi:GNAT superfamily N-acetyltransferase